MNAEGRRWGDEHPVVVLVHGQPGDSGDFNEILKRLPARVRCFSYDRPGWGRSAASATDVKGNSDYLVELLRSQGIVKAIVVGYSYGSTVALRATIDFPDLFSGLILVSPVGSVLSMSMVDRMLTLWASFLLSFPVIRSLVLRNQSRARLIESFYQEQVSLAGDLRDLSDGISSIDLPVSLIVGADDLFNPLKGTLGLLDTLPKVEMKLLPGVGHLLPDQAPEVVAERIFSMWSDQVNH